MVRWGRLLSSTVSGHQAVDMEFIFTFQRSTEYVFGTTPGSGHSKESGCQSSRPHKERRLHSHNNLQDKIESDMLSYLSNPRWRQHRLHPHPPFFFQFLSCLQIQFVSNCRHRRSQPASIHNLSLLGTPYIRIVVTRKDRES